MANQVTTTFRIDAQGAINSLNQYNAQLQKTVQLQKQLGGTGTGATTGGGAGGGGGLGGALGSAKSLLGPLAGFVSFAAISAGIKEALRASTEATRANRALSSSAIEAGKSYGELAKSARAFGEAAGISSAQAARSTAQLQRLVTLAGDASQLEKYQQGFLDLAAARGVAFEELDTLFSGIIAGTDDALNRFGKADPSKLAAQYAAQIGKTVDQLTEQDKILSRLVAFAPDFENFQGANEARLKSFDGQVDKFNSRLEDTLAYFGRWISSSYVLGEALDFLNNKLKPDENQSFEIRTRLEAGETVDSIADDLNKRFQEQTSGVGRISFFGGAIGAYETELKKSKFPEQIRATVELEAQQYKASQGAAIDAISALRRQRRLQDLKFELSQAEANFNDEKALLSASLSIFEAERRQYLDGSKAAELQYNREVSAARINALRAEREAQNDIFRQRMMMASFEGKQEEFDKIRREQSVFFRQQNLAIGLEILAQREKERQLQKQIAEDIKRINLDLRNQLLGFAGDRNPYVRIFSEAQTAAEELIEKTKEFGFEFKRSILQGLQQRANIALFQQDITNLRGAVALRREARELDYGYDPSQFSQEEAEAYRRRSISEDLEAIEAAFRRTDRSAQAQRLRDQAIIDATRGANYRELFYEDRAEAVAAREREATRLEQDRSSARAAFDRLLNEFDNGGVRVRIAEGQTLIRIIDESNGRAEIATRPSNASTGARYR